MRQMAIIVAGGSGSRFGAAQPKQFVILRDKPVLMWTIDAFARQCDRLVVVLPESHHELWRQLCRQYACTLAHEVVAGGATRWHSVCNGLARLDIAVGDIVAVHDGVRPLVSQQLIRRVFEQAQALGSAVPAVPLTDSVRQLDAQGTSHAIDRDTLRAVQTPQAFDAVALRAAYEQPYRTSFTDDASVYEAAGRPVHLADGDPTNIKITHLSDLRVAQQLMEHEQ